MNATSSAVISAADPSGYADRPDYHVNLLRRSNLVEVRSGARLIASSSRAILVDEQDHALDVYVPCSDVDVNALVPVASRSTHCPFKGEARYWALRDAAGEPVAWSYAALYAEVAALAGHIAFYQDKVELRLGGRGGLQSRIQRCRHQAIQDVPVRNGQPSSCHEAYGGFRTTASVDRDVRRKVLGSRHYHIAGKKGQLSAAMICLQCIAHAHDVLGR